MFSLSQIKQEQLNTGMIDKLLFYNYCDILEDIQKDFPSFIEVGSKYKQETKELWWELLNESDCNNSELAAIIGRVIYHIYNCKCHIIPNSKNKFDEALNLINNSPDSKKETLGKAIISDLNLGYFDWFEKYSGTKTYVVYSHLYQHLIAHRSNKEITYCPFAL